MAELEARLGFEFANPELLQTALTHASLVAEEREEMEDNQRLEFLGDAVLELVLTEELYRRFPQHGEGVLTKWRARLVSRHALAEFGSRVRLGESMRMGKGETASGGRTRPSTLADCTEAVFGAVYLDGGLEAARKVILQLIGESLNRVVEAGEEGNPKGELQEALQAIVPESPVYRIVSETGPDHDKRFVASVIWRGQELGRGEGSSKKEAEASAAAKAIELRVWDQLPGESP
ncbi:MAG: ribonuclease III [Verrucomicrobiota bacterium]